ncbi:acetyltransferase [Streptomyces olivochromogenes]|uniref:Acetyltransferase n=1 Tax=Streptomyces olivochromogenes TaxID=1963 RepID=A0A250VQ30_STROL|nr:acetyltransferase [Streptomyces olivochromogenes]
MPESQVSASGIGAGVASCALAALTDWALNEIGFYRLQLDHSTRNHASCRAATKSGYLLEGTKRSAALHDDGRHDMHLHARIRGDRARPIHCVRSQMTVERAR